MKINQPKTQVTESSADYELIDSGNGEKLERFGKFVLSRPDPQALWPKRKESSVWENADAIFHREGNETEWEIKSHVPGKWQINFGELSLRIKPTSFKHTGLFPEQLSNWQWIEDCLKSEKRKISVLNLFAYTGGATLSAARAGAEVCHVDGSKKAIDWARENAELSNLDAKPIRWILDDVISFMKKELRRGRRYDGIIMDPPSFGRGPKSEKWKIEENFLELMSLSKDLLSDNPLFFLVNGYVAGYSAIAYENSLREVVGNSGEIEIGELTIAETDGERLLPCGIFARWKNV
ncbi:class I SAM-dependent methyltransferase [Patescibacteria group bacterium]|nr:class I SAM-dependent methyltransferase [Patescibacteria group bacterium]